MDFTHYLQDIEQQVITAASSEEAYDIVREIENNIYAINTSKVFISNSDIAEVINFEIDCFYESLQDLLEMAIRYAEATLESEDEEEKYGTYEEQNRSY